ncbi:MAG: ATP phosphoribosyltransferase regulatory subunit [candidate division KSB1 bacterium]|nr:ATP phosphoribosyltransferase regulatory subunit [candidate division KSB1 bacterium]MDQ7064964.1 ATP phosphoribosyltransferase regulatory subunit [candidate division KSB1 bacterium]
MNQIRHLPPGVKDFLFEEARRRRQVERLLTGLLEQRGYQEIITPTFEYGEVFLAASREEELKNGLPEKMYRFLDRNGQFLALRSDFTAQIARIAATRLQGMEPPIHIYYSGKVFRAEAQHAGKSREKWQVGFEILGDGGFEADTRAICTILDAFAALSLRQVRIAIGHIGFFDGVLNGSVKLASEARRDIKYLIERKDVEGLRLLCEQLDLPSGLTRALMQIPALHGDASILQRARQITAQPSAIAAIEHLEKLWQNIAEHPGADSVFIDLSEVEGMGYYTGIMIKAFAAGIGQEVGSGGRYDDLVARFGRAMPAVGFSFDVDLLVEASRNASQSGGAS